MPPPGCVIVNSWPSNRSFGTTNSDSPRAPDFMSGLVRASSARTSARPANVHQALAPVMNQPLCPPCSPRSARQRTAATSEPVSGSVTEMPTIRSPAATGGSQRCFCASVPPFKSAFVRISGRVSRLPAAASDADDSSSVIRIITRLPIPWPPYSSGIDIPKYPSSRIASMIDAGTSSSWRWMCSAWGATSLRANCRAESRAITAMSSGIHVLLTPRVRMTSRPISRKRASCCAARTAASTSGSASVLASSRVGQIEVLARPLDPRPRSRSATSAANAAAIASVVASPSPAARRWRAYSASDSAAFTSVAAYASRSACT